VKFDCTLQRSASDRWTARHRGALGDVAAVAATQAEALERLRAELRYRCELCPCTGVPDDYVELVVTDTAPR
jgi:hypothetical protein